MCIRDRPALAPDRAPDPDAGRSRRRRRADVRSQPVIRVAIIAAVAAIAAAGACSIDHRSGDFACTKQSDCNGGRVCDDGFCTDPNAADAPTDRPDAADGHADANECPSECTSCNPEAHTCVIDCNAGANCDAQVTCPSGYTCDIRCNVGNSCRNGVDCQSSKGCSITCSCLLYTSPSPRDS